ncbi:dbo [Symbiodinium necroappetens]|uniref:Dbo protein n=1 Tax=Symbiodinium necroappetens TaxID=1628268 RepID=A0A813BNF0_9DINO|nr:dbo [Symbiodinium necroappetens]
MATTVDAEVLAGYITLANLEGLRKFAPPDFDWRQPLGSAKEPALVLVITQGLITGNHASQLQIAEWLLKAGAEPTYKITQKPGCCRVWKVNQKDTTELMVPYEGHSAVSFAFSWLGQFQLGKGGADWSKERISKTLWGSLRGRHLARNPMVRMSPCRKVPWTCGSPCATRPHHTT